MDNLTPFKDNPESPLWVNISKANFGKRLTHASASRILYQACRRAKINKKMNLKLFRHSETTRTAMFMTEATLRKRHGWSSTSKMPAKYVHINQKDVEDSILNHYGIKLVEDKENRVPKICPICKNLNSFDADMCDNCSKPLSIEHAIKIDEERQEEKLLLIAVGPEYSIDLSLLDLALEQAKKNRDQDIFDPLILPKCT